MKKVFLLFVLIILQSCIPLHRAKRIPSYEISDAENTKNTYVDLSTYTFQYEADYHNFRNIIRRFFELPEDVNVYNFETEALIEGRKVNVYISEDSDVDRYINLLGFLIHQNDDDNNETQREKEDRERREEASEKSRAIKYLNIQIMDQDGSDLLADDGLLKTIAIQKLKQFQRKINSDE